MQTISYFIKGKKEEKRKEMGPGPRFHIICWIFFSFEVFEKYHFNSFGSCFCQYRPPTSSKLDHWI